MASFFPLLGRRGKKEEASRIWQTKALSGIKAFSMPAAVGLKISGRKLAISI